MLIVDQIKRSDRPLWSLTLGILGGLLILLAGLWYLQVVRTKTYLASQLTQSVRKVRIPALRGKILDRNGQVLAENRPSFNLNLYLEELGPQFREAFRIVKGGRKLNKLEREELGRRTRYAVVSSLVRQLSGLLQQPLQIEEERFLKHYTNSLALPLPILENLSATQMARFLEQPNKPPGLSLDTQPLRYYPNDATASHLLGQLQRLESIAGEEPDFDYDYCLPDFAGTVGLEAGFDGQLRGTPGVKALMVNNLGYRQHEDIWSPAEAGDSLVLTIDLRLQKEAEKALQNAPHGASGFVKGAVVVLDPGNGDLLALASFPSYNPNSFVPRMPREEWQKLNDPALWKDPDLKPLLNRATQGTYAPGSIFKILIALAGLESGTLDPKEIYHSPGYFRLSASSTIDDPAGPGDYDFHKAFVKSSNAYFAFHCLQAGLPNVVRLGQRFFLGQAVRLPLRQENKGFFPTQEWLDRRKERGESILYADKAMLGIGQGRLITVTPLQMAMMTAAVANGGRVFWPRLLIERLDARESPGQNQGRRRAGRVRGELGVRPEHLSLIRAAMMGDVLEKGSTGARAFVPGMDVCGKTGTAQFSLPEGGKRHDTWFVSFAPYENPQYVVVVFVEGGGSGGGTCAPVARIIYQAIQKLEGASATKGATLAKAHE